LNKIKAGKTISKGKTISTFAKTKAIADAKQQVVIVQRLENVETLVRDTKALLDRTITEFERVVSVVNFHAKAVGDNTSRTARLDTFVLSAAKELEELKTLKLDMIDTVKSLVKDEIKLQLNDPIKPGPINQDIARLNGLVTTFNTHIETMYERITRIERKLLWPDKSITVDGSVVSQSITNLEKTTDELVSKLAEIQEFDNQIRAEIQSIINNIYELKRNQLTVYGTATGILDSKAVNDQTKT
jgi:hypothetical protein